MCAMSPRLLRPLASGFNPKSIAGLALWLDAADTSTVSLDGSSNVEEWRDKSGLSRHAGQTTAANRPDYAATQNGKKVVTFAGSPESMRTTSFSLAQPATVFCVIRPNVTSATMQFLDGFSSGNRMAVGVRSTNTFYVFAGTVLDGGSTSTNWRLVGGVFNGASSTTRVGGSQVASGNAGTDTIDQGFSIASFNSISSVFNGSMAEILVYGQALPPSAIAAAERYLQSKWGL